MRINASLFLLLSLLLPAATGCDGRGATEAPKPAQPSETKPAEASPADTAAAEQQKGTGSAKPTAKTRIDACSLVKSEDLLAIQGEAVRETKLTESAEGSIATGHCLYIMPTYSKSLSLALTQRDRSKGEGVKLKDFWEERFRTFEADEEKGGKDREKESGERERQKKSGKERPAEREREGEEESKPVRVEGIGEEAFWIGNRLSGALYVFSKNSILRLSLGGPEDEATKISRLKALAQKAIKRL